MTKPELLAPAGSFDALVAAVSGGADAVYLGGSRFNARQFADNFSDEMLKEAVSYAHLYGVKVYVTLNTLMKEKELNDLEKYLKLLENIKADGVIIQDLGVAKIISDEFPRIALHGSTQMTVHNQDGVRFLEKLGFKRVVLSRELDLDEIKHISENTNIETEIFIHGALCICYSGQCLMSSFIGGRSGNRGMCAQPCRLPYKTDTGKSPKSMPRYYISPKDLSSVKVLEKIIKSGVRSLKIEGRMKRPEYVAVVTGVYRGILDKLYNGETVDDFAAYEEELMQIFNRGGFTSDYLEGKSTRGMISLEKPNNWGVYLGRTTDYRNGFAYIRLENTLETGDNIEFHIKSGENKGKPVDNINGKPVEKALPGQTVKIKTGFPVEKGTVVYKTSSISQLREAQIKFSNRYYRKIPMKAKGEFKLNLPARLTLSDEDGVSAGAILDNAVQPAKNMPVSYEKIAAQLGKLGDTPYILSSADLEVDEIVFVSAADINRLRRDAVDALNKRRIELFEGRNRMNASSGMLLKSDRNAKISTVMSEDGDITLSGYVDTLDYPVECLNGLDTVNYDPLTWPTDPDNINKVIARVKELKSEGHSVNLVLPRIAREEDMNILKDTLPVMSAAFDGYIACNPGILNFLNEYGLEPVICGYPMNIFNSEAVKLLADFGVKAACLSPELTTGEIRDIIDRSILPCEILVFGSVPLMITEHDLSVPALYDRKGYEFKLRKRRISRSYTEIMNSLPVFPIDSIKAVQSLSGLAWGLYLHGMSAEAIKKAVAVYNFASKNPGNDLPESLLMIAGEIKSAGFTKGHLFRGVD